MMNDIPDFVREAEEQMAAGVPLPTPMEEVTIKFGRGLMGEPFTSKGGKELVEIRIPNQDAADSRPWESFVVPANMVHENKYGKGMWMKLPAENSTKLSRSVRVGEDAEGKPQWGTETRTVTNQELKALVEHYKEKSRSSVVGDLASKTGEALAWSAPRSSNSVRKNFDR